MGSSEEPLDSEAEEPEPRAIDALPSEGGVAASTEEASVEFSVMPPFLDELACERCEYADPAEGGVGRRSRIAS